MKVLLLIDTRNWTFPKKWYRKYKELSIDVKLLSFYNADYLQLDDYIRIKTWIPSHRLKMIGKLSEIKNKIKSFKPDIIHAIQVTRQGFLASLIDYHPMIVTAIGSDIFIEPKKSIIEKWIVQRCFKKADLVTSMAEHMTDYIKKNFKIDEKKLITFPWGCDTKIFNLENRKVNENEPIIITTRSMTNVLYNQELIINAIPEVLKHIPEAKFIFIGDGYLRTKYEKLCEKLKVKNSVKFLGWQTQEQIAEWLKKSMIFISVARSDGNNISLNEAMACGCFPICTDIPANRQWYNEPDSGFFVNPDNSEELAEKIIIAIKDKKLRKKAEEINCQTVSERGDWHKQALKMLEIYKKLKNGNWGQASSVHQ